MSHGIEIIDVGDIDGFEPLSPLPRDDRDRAHYDDIPEIRPSMPQRMSGLSLSDKKTITRVRRDSSLDRDNYVYWRLEKEGDDWAAAYRRKLLGTQNEIEKIAKKGKGSVLAETTKMGGLRSQHLTRLVDDQNDGERGEETWEPVYIKSDKVRKKSGRIECKSMDVILSRRLPSPKTAVKKYRSGSGGELVDIITESKPRGNKKEKKDKDKDRSSSPKRDSYLDDPFSSTPLFHSSGAPLNARGVMDRNDDLPPDIPHDRPIGYGARDEKNGDKSDKKSKDADDFDPILNVIDLGDHHGDSIDAILNNEASHDVPYAEPGRRSSRSSRRIKASRSRTRSRNRPESISFPPNFDSRQPAGDHGDSSSFTSEESRYGIDREERSSYTSHETYPSIGRRGSYADGTARPHAKVYKEHYAGPSGNRPKSYYHGEAKVFEEPATRRRRYSRGSFSQPERIPEIRQIDYGSYNAAHDRDLVPRRRDPPYDDPDPGYYPRRPVRPSGPTGPVLHYPSEMHDRRAERYMDESVRDDVLDRRERELSERERRLDAAEQREEDARRQEERYRRDLEADARYQEEVDRREFDRARGMREEEESRRYHDDRYRDDRYGGTRDGYRPDRRYYE